MCPPSLLTPPKDKLEKVFKLIISVQSPQYCPCQLASHLHTAKPKGHCSPCKALPYPVASGQFPRPLLEPSLSLGTDSLHCCSTERFSMQALCSGEARKMKRSQWERHTRKQGSPVNSDETRLVRGSGRCGACSQVPLDLHQH